VQARLDSMAGRRVGYLKLKSFTARTQPDVAAAVKHLQVPMTEPYTISKPCSSHGVPLCSSCCSAVAASTQTVDRTVIVLSMLSP